MSAVVYTQFSQYEVDTENKRVRRVLGINPPTSALSEDGVWRDYISVNYLYNSLFIQWVEVNPETGNPRATRTSDIVKIDGELDVPAMTVVQLP
jgi:hypothetical protein